MLNGLVADLDLEFRAGGPNAKGISFAQLDIQNVNGQVVTKLTINSIGLGSNWEPADLIIDGVVAAQIPVNGWEGTASVTYSSDPTGTELPFPLGFPVPHVGSTILVNTQFVHGIRTAVQTYVI